MAEEVLFLCGFAFVAGLVDAVVGGGALIQVPALFALLPDVPPAVVLGTNKLSSIAGTTIAAWRYSRSLQLPVRELAPVALAAFVTAIAGAWVVGRLPAELFRPIGLGMLVLVAVYVALRPKLGLESKSRQLGASIERLFGGAVGFYDGFLGPGTGSFFVFGYVRWLGRDFLSAAASTKLLNLVTNAGALLLFLAFGQVRFDVGLPMMLANVAGGYLGASVAIAGGSRFVRGVFLVISWLLILKLASDLLQ